MTVMNIAYKTEKSDEFVWKWLDENLEMLLSRKVPTEQIECVADRSRQVIDFKGKTVKGTMLFKEGNFDITIELPLLYRMFGPQIRTAVLDILQAM